MRELILTLVAAVAILAAGLVALGLACRPAPDDDDTSAAYARAEDGLITAMSMLLVARAEWAEAARRPGRHAGGSRG